MPEHYADMTPEAISKQLRQLGVIGKIGARPEALREGQGPGLRPGVAGRGDRQAKQLASK
jgi:hypothetical protein